MHKKLDALDIKVMACTDCYLCKNEHFKPYWSLNSKYVMLFEYPHKKKEDFMVEFWNIANRNGLAKDQFLIINTVQCLPDMSRRNGRFKYNPPAKIHRETCRSRVLEYYNIIKPKKMLAFGNLSMEECNGEFSGITEKHGSKIVPKFGGFVIPTVLSVHPAVIKYNGQQGIDMIDSAFKSFKEI